MKKKFCLVLLLITAICLSAGVAQADPKWLEGTWRMRDSTAGSATVTLVGDTEPPFVHDDANANGTVLSTISNVQVDEGGEIGTFDLSSNGKYEVFLSDEYWTDFEWTLKLDGKSFDIHGDVFTIEDIVYNEEVSASLKIDLKSATFAVVTMSIVNEFTIWNSETEEEEEYKVELDFEFDANKILDSDSSSNSGGGCDTGAGFGLFLALGALAIAKRAKRKP